MRTPVWIGVVVLVLLGTVVAARADLNDGLVAYYPLDGNADDGTGGGRDGTVVGATLVPDRFGTPNSAYHFDGAGNHISTFADGLPTLERTVTLWFRADSLSTHPVMVGYGGGNCGSSWFMGVNAGNVPGFYMSSHCDVNTINFETCNPAVGAWTHFAVATDAAGTRLYINGVLAVQNTTFVSTTTTAGTQLGIGVASAPEGYVPYTDINIGYFAGDLDDVRIYDRALSPIELQTLAAGTAPFDCPVCGDGSQTPGEQCDDGNTANGDCCSSTCQYDTNGSPCPADGNPCTVDTCDGAGSCGQLPTGCKDPGKSLLLIKNNATDDSKDKLVWKWLKGAETSLEDLGVPTGTTNYTLCLYAGTASASIALPAGSNWQTAGSKGYKFKDKSGTPDGAQKALLKSGADGKAKALVKGKGTNLPDAILPDTLAPMLPLPVTAQLVNDTNSTCFEATYNTVIKNDTKQFKAKTP